MRYTTDSGIPFDTDNRAYRRFRAVADEHFQVIGWDNADTGRPTLLTLTDTGSGDAFSVALLDSAEDAEPHILLAFTATAQVTGRGPFRGGVAAATHAPRLARHDATIAATTPVVLHDPATPAIGEDEWLTIPPDYARAARAAGADAPATALVLLDRDRAQLAVVGPFPCTADAQAWQPEPDGWPPVDRLTVAVHPPAAADPA